MILDIVKRIHERYPNAKIYVENVEQGLKPPCFLVTPTNCVNNRGLQDRFKFTHGVMVQYIPATKNIKTECTEIMQELLILLCDFGNYHADSIEGNVGKESLNVSLTYSEFKQGINDVDDMENVKLNIRG